MCCARARSPLIVVLALGVLEPSVAKAQAAPAYPGQGAFASGFPEAHRILLSAESVEGLLLSYVFERLGNEPGIPGLAAAEGTDPATHAGAAPTTTVGEREAEAYAELVALLQDGADGAQPPPPAPPITGMAARRLAEVLEAGHALRRRILDVYADDSVADKAGAVAAAVAAFESNPEASLPAIPKAMDLMYLERYSGIFRSRYARLSGLLSSIRWIEFAAFEPLLAPTVEERASRMATVTERFWQKFESPPDRFPTELPMAPTIAPGLLLRHRPAAAALDNVNMLYELVTNALLAADAVDEEAEIAKALARFSSADEGVTSEYEWIRMALRHGIFNQGGPAVGTLEHSERNDSMSHIDHMTGGSTVLPGMPGG